MLRIIGLLITLPLFGYGLIRIGVGGILLAQSYELINFNHLASAIFEVQSFIEVREEKQIIPFSLSGYFAYIMAMGVFLTAGAIGVGELRHFEDSPRMEMVKTFSIPDCDQPQGEWNSVKSATYPYNEREKRTNWYEL